MGTRMCFADDLFDLDSPNQERVTDQGAMAAPWNSLSAHDCRTPLLCQLNQFVQRIFKIRSLHVVGIAAKAGISPA